MSGLTPIIRGASAKGRPRRHKPRRRSYAPIMEAIRKHLLSLPPDVRRDTADYLRSEAVRLNRRRDHQR